MLQLPAGGATPRAYKAPVRPSFLPEWKGEAHAKLVEQLELGAAGYRGAVSW